MMIVLGLGATELAELVNLHVQESQISRIAERTDLDFLEDRGALAGEEERLTADEANIIRGRHQHIPCARRQSPLTCVPSVRQVCWRSGPRPWTSA